MRSGKKTKKRIICCWLLRLSDSDIHASVCDQQVVLRCRRLSGERCPRRRRGGEGQRSHPPPPLVPLRVGGFVNCSTRPDALAAASAHPATHRRTHAFDPKQWVPKSPQISISILIENRNFTRNKRLVLRAHFSSGAPRKSTSYLYLGVAWNLIFKDCHFWKPQK